MTVSQALAARTGCSLLVNLENRGWATEDPS